MARSPLGSRVLSDYTVNIFPGLKERPYEHTYLHCYRSALKNTFITVDIFPNRSESTYSAFDHNARDDNSIMLVYYIIIIRHNRARTYIYIQYVYASIIVYVGT